MKHYRFSSDCDQNLQSDSPRRGSTLLIVLALLGLLTLLGLVFFTFANQEHISAEFFTESAKQDTDELDNGMDYGIRNLLIGPQAGRRNSVLYGRHNMVTNLTGGNDSRPHSGTGVNLIYWDDPSTPLVVERIPALDQNRDGIPDPISPDSTQNLVNLVDAQSAHGGRIRDIRRLGPADSGTTYPDSNSMFLSWKGHALRQTGAGAQLVPVIIPSFMRPGLFRQGSENSVTATDWFDPAGLGPDGVRGTSDDPYTAFSFRPHRSHVYVTPEGKTIDDGTGNPVRRYLDSGNPADAAIIGGLPGGSGGWPFRPPAQPTGNPLHDSKQGELGIFTATAAEMNDPTFDPSVYELDVDTDGDSIPDAIWLDLDYPVLEDPNTGARYTFMYAVSVVDMEALLNLNVHGNLVGDRSTWSPVGGVDAALGRPGALSRSNAGVTPSEVNPLYALMRDPALGSGTSFQQHQRFFGHVPVNAYEQANMEWLWLLLGRPELSNGPIPVGASDITDLYAGRFGEAGRLYDASTNAASIADFFARGPKPGLAGQDDNNDVLEGAPGYGLRGVTMPLDYVGAGRWVLAANPRRPRLHTVVDQTTGLPSGVQVPQYQRYSLFSPTGNPLNAPLGPNQFHYRGEDGVMNTADDLILSPTVNPLFDDINEGIAEPEKALRPFDEIFGHSDAIGLHMTDADITAAGDEVSERPRDLAPFAFERQAIRERFTTSSWSLKQYPLAIPFPPGILHPLGRDGKPGWANVDDDGDTTVDEPDEVGTFNPMTHPRSEDGFRAWLFNADTALFDSTGTNVFTPNRRYEFPPRYGRVREFSSREIGVRSAPAVPPFAQQEADGTVSEDPFRPQLRRLLRLEAGDSRSTFGQLPLNINRFLDVERLPDRAADLIRGTLEYRPLTEHLDSVNSDGSSAANVLTQNNVTPCPYPPRDFNGDGSLVDEQEYWARRDRQKMARDIYVLLYTLGGGNDRVNYTSSNLTITPGALPTDPPTDGTYRHYTPAQLRAMAQFAVNLVDALDRDDVVTRFEYDKNLGDTLNSSGAVVRSGWNLDDNAATRDGFPPIPDTYSRPDGTQGGYDGNFPEDSFERGVVYGVERQKISFSEVLAFYTRDLTADHTATLYDDDIDAHAFLQIELQNLTSQDVPLATPQSTNDSTAVYRIRRFNEDTPSNISRENHGKLAFLRDAPVVGAGRPYVVATTDGNDIDTAVNEHRPSDFYVDYDQDGSFNRIAPAINGGFPTVASRPSDPELQPRADIDLVHARDRDPSRQVFSVNGAGIAAEGAFLTQAGGGSMPMFDRNNPAATKSHVLVLERRANPHMPSLPLSENPWVEVDRAYARFQVFDLQESAAPNMTLTDMENAPMSQGLLAQLGSEYRSEALEAVDPGTMLPQTAYSFGRRNTLGQSNANPSFLLQQPHYDRDYTSLGDLLRIPLFGPDSLTTQLADSMRPGNRVNSDDQYDDATSMPAAFGNTGLTRTAEPPVETYGRMRPRDESLVSGANAKFLMADFRGLDTDPPPLVGMGLTQADLDNRWYLMFSMLEVPSRVHRQFGNPLLNLDRVPGKINLNTIRHPQILAALLDDPLVVDVDTIADANGSTLDESGAVDSSPLPSNPLAGNRGDWWQEFIASRDGAFSPPSGGHTLYIPGIPGSKPFEPFGHMGGTNFTLSPVSVAAEVPGQDQERTLLRTLFTDFSDPNGDGRDENNAGRRLFEVGTPADFEGPAAGGTIGMTPETRHRLLSKVLNNSTTSSNTFVVHMTIGYFEVFEDPSTGAVRIGGEYDITPGDGQPASLNRKRSVFLLDRSEAPRAFDAGTQQFDYRRLIKHEVTIQ